MASALDPRFKLQWCSPDEFSSIKANLILKGRQDSNLDLDTASGAPESFETVSNHPQKPSLTFFDNLIQDKVQPTTSSTIESAINEYLATACLKQEEDPLLFWKNNEDKYPTLAKLARTYLCIPASSAPVKRIFSIAGKIFRPERCRLKDDTFQQLMFVRCNEFNM